MPGADKQPYVEDATDDDMPTTGGCKSNNSSAPPSVKEEANVSRMRNTDRRRRGESASPMKDLYSDSDSDSAGRRSVSKRTSERKTESKDKEAEREKEKEKEAEKLKVKRKSVTYEHPRPPTGRAKTTPNLNIQTASSIHSRRQTENAPTPSPIIAAAATASRPRAYTAQTASGPIPAPRPVSYYGPPGSGPSKPPLSNMRYYVSGQPAPLGASWAPPPLSPAPYPPHSPFFYPPTAPPYAGPYPPSHAFPPPPAYAPPPADYFPQGLRAQPPRHEYRRPRSAMGTHPSKAFGREYDDDDLEDRGFSVTAPSVRRRPSTRQQEEERNRTLMPPPPIRRPSTSAPLHSLVGPPRPKRPSVSSIRSINYLDNDSIDDESQYSPSEQSRTDWRAHSVRRPVVDHLAHDLQSRYERSPDGQRRNSLYGSRTHSDERDFEEKMQHAQRYQERYDGPTAELTADMLRKMTRTPSHRTPSHRTKSTGSRGEDSYALTNRNSVDTEDMTILVRGAATLTIGDASMAVQDGAEIRIPTNVGGGDRMSRGGSTGSDMASAGADRRTRLDRPPTHSGGPSRASRSRSRARGLPAAAGYYLPPPPTEYPSTEYSGHGGQYQYGHGQQAPAMYAPPSGYPYPM